MKEAKWEYFEIGVEHQEFVGGDEKVYVRRGLSLAIWSLRNHSQNCLKSVSLIYTSYISIIICSLYSLVIIFICTKMISCARAFLRPNKHIPVQPPNYERVCVCVCVCVCVHIYEYV